MANLSSVNWIPSQRVDVSDMRAIESYVASDLRALVNMITGPSEPFVVRGFEIVSAGNAQVSLSLANAMVFTPAGGVGSFYLGTPAQADLVVPLIKGATNYIQLIFKRESQTTVTRGIWDQTSPTADSPAGTQFSASVKIQNVMVPDEVSLVSQAGRIAGAASVAIVDVASDGTVSNFRDDRTLLFRQGRPTDPAYKFPWAATRTEPAQSTTLASDLADSNTSSVYYARDASTGKIVNDKGITNLKDFFDALMTSLAEIRGSAVWYAGSGASVYLDNLNLNTAYMDSEAGHHWEPKANAFIQWSKPDPSTGVPDYKLRSTATDTISWGLNYGNVSWELGGSFTTAGSTNGSLNRRSFTGVSASKLFSSGAVDSGLNVYLALERDVTPAGASNNTVTWTPAALPPFSAAQLWSVSHTVSGIQGDFTGIAIGDWVRKATDGQWAYYKVRRLLIDNGTASGIEVGATGSSASPTIVAGDDGAIANPSVVALELDRPIVPSGTTVQKLVWFRSRYVSGDVIVETLAQRNQTVPPYRSTSYYWLGYAYDNAGAFSGRYFMLRSYGVLSPGEEVQSLDDSEKAVDYTAGNSELALDTASNITYDGAALTGTPFLLNIARRLTDNLIPNAGGAANKASINYQLVAGGSLSIITGQELWVNLQDTFSATTITLTPGPVASTTNSYQVLSASAAPVRSLTNRNVFCLGRVTSDGYFQFADGTKVAAQGLFDRSPRLINNVLVGGNAVAPLVNTSTLTLGSSLGATQFSGGQIIKRRYTNTLNTLLTYADYLLSVDTVAIFSACAVSLPPVSSISVGQVFCIKDATGAADIKPITVTGFGYENIDGAVTQLIDGPYGQLTVVWNGTSYEII